MTFWTGVQFTDGTGFDNEDFVSGDLDDLREQVDAYLAHLNNDIPPFTWTIANYYSEPDGTLAGSDFRADRWYIELNKDNLIALFHEVRSPLTNWTAWRTYFVEESPRDTWSHGQ